MFFALDRLGVSTPNNPIYFLSLAVDQSSEGIAITDLEGNLEYVNTAFAPTHGYTPNELSRSV